MNDDSRKELGELVNAVVAKVNLRGEDVNRLIQVANEKEFEIAKYLFAWTLAGFGFYAGILKLFITNSENVLKFYLSFFLFFMSLLFGLAHYMSYRNQCNSMASHIDKTNSAFIRRFHDSTHKARELHAIIEDFKEEEKRPRIVKGSLLFLRLQLYSFMTAILWIFWVLTTTI